MVLAVLGRSTRSVPSRSSHTSRPSSTRQVPTPSTTTSLGAFPHRAMDTTLRRQVMAHPMGIAHLSRPKPRPPDSLPRGGPSLPALRLPLGAAQGGPRRSLSLLPRGGRGTRLACPLGSPRCTTRWGEARREVVRHRRGTGCQGGTRQAGRVRARGAPLQETLGGRESSGGRGRVQVWGTPQGHPLCPAWDSCSELGSLPAGAFLLHHREGAAYPLTGEVAANWDRFLCLTSSEGGNSGAPAFWSVMF